MVHLRLLNSLDFSKVSIRLADQGRKRTIVVTRDTDQDKNEMLAEAFKILTATVEPSKINTTNFTIKTHTTKTTGKIINANGDEYDGEIVNGVACGRGVIREKNGDLYEGTMLNGLRHGEGKVTEISPVGFNGKVNYFEGVAIGTTIYQANSRSNFIKTSEGGFDNNGLWAGPYYNTSHDGDYGFELNSNGLRNGPFIVLTKDLATIGVSQFKDGKEVTPMTHYTPVQTYPPAQTVPVNPNSQVNGQKPPVQQSTGVKQF